MINSPNHSSIQSLIASYTAGREPLNLGLATLQCFVGMLETGEATIEDFRVAGGSELAKLVNKMTKFDWKG